MVDAELGEAREDLERAAGELSDAEREVRRVEAALQAAETNLERAKAAMAQPKADQKDAGSVAGAEARDQLPEAPRPAPRPTGAPGGTLPTEPAPRDQLLLAAAGVGCVSLLGAVALTSFPELPETVARTASPVLSYVLLVGVAFFVATIPLLAALQKGSGTGGMLLLLLLLASAGLTGLAVVESNRAGPDDETVLIVVSGSGRVTIGASECRASGARVTPDDTGRGLEPRVECRIRLPRGAHSVQFDPDTGMQALVSCDGHAHRNDTSCELPAWSRTVRADFVPETVDGR